MRATMLVHIAKNDYLKTLRQCGGYYECPKKDGKRLGPLVGYAGTYENEAGAKKHWVGDVYYNFARVEEYPHVLDYFANQLAIVNVLTHFSGINAVIGTPMGGILPAGALARKLDCRCLFMEKKVTAVATADGREKSELVFSRHELQSGMRVILVEDVVNNFSTTNEAAQLIKGSECSLVAIACFLNRSTAAKWVPEEFGCSVPVISLLHIPTAQWKQDDPEVAHDIKTANVVWKPKAEWPKLMAAMEAAN